jgi:uncharacterized protein YodC (DUF2158 family)
VSGDTSIEQGAVVFLKSGGPKMTVASVDYDEAKCDWFSGDVLKSGLFPTSSLRLDDEITRIVRVIVDPKDGSNA